MDVLTNLNIKARETIITTITYKPDKTVHPIKVINK